MQSAIEIRQGKVRRLEGQLRCAARAGRFAEEPHVVSIVVDNRLIEQVSERSEVELLALRSYELAFVSTWDRHAHVGQAGPLRF